MRQAVLFTFAASQELSWLAFFWYSGALAVEWGTTGQGAVSMVEPASDQIAMRYAAPPDDLSDWISSLYNLEQHVTDFEQTERPDRPQLRIMLQGSGYYAFADGHSYDASDVVLIGPTTAPFVAHATGPLVVCGAGLKPAAWGTLLGADAERTVDRVINAESVFGDRAQRLLHALRTADDIDQRFAHICDFVRDIMEAARDGAPMHFIRIMDEWLEEGGGADVAALIERTGLPTRQVERLSKRYYGLPPRSLARKYRAVRTMAALARGDDIDALGLGAQFYDQSHLIREMKRFAGMTPAQIRQHQSELLEVVSKGRKSLTGQVAPLVSDA